jgi:ABC-type polysaccharide/polyol phosphate export permease
MPRGIHLHKLAEIYHYRELLKNLVVTELKLRYRRSILGFVWTMLNPLLMMIVLTLVFSTIMRFDTKDYWVLLLSGLLPWIFFSQSISLSLMSVVSKGNLLKKVYIAKALIPLSAVLACLVNFLLSLFPLFLLMVALGHSVNETILFLPVAVVLLTLFTSGLAFLFSCLNVFFRDFTHMTEVLLSAWFYLSPVIYSLQLVPEQYRGAFYWNPMLYLIELFRAPIYEGRWPAIEVVGVATAAAFLSCVVGFGIFVRYERSFVMRV